MEKLKNTYYDPAVGLISSEKLYEKLKGEYTREQIKEFLKKQETEQLHHRQNKNRYYPIVGVLGTYQTDLTFYEQYSKSNKGFWVILTAIDINSRKGYARALKNKQEETVIEGFKSIIEEAGNIKIVGFDGGSEFQNKFKAMLKSHGIEYYVSDPNDKNKMAMVERFNRTVREKIEKYLTAYKTNKWYDVLHLLMENYNNTIHSSIGVTPNKFSKKDYDEMQEKNLDKIRSIKQEKESFIVGDKVRVLKTKTVFEKKATERYYRGIYEIIKVNAFSYKVKNDTGIELKKTIKPHELLKVDHVESLDIDKPHDREKEVKEHKRERKFKIEGVDIGNIIPSKRETLERTLRHERQGVDVGNIISNKRRI